MRSVGGHIMNLWQQGGPFIGDDGAPHHRVTVEPDWFLNTESAVSTIDPSTLPYRWFQREDDSQVELEIPNLVSIETDATIDSDAATATIVVVNQKMNPNLTGQARRLGDPGYLTAERTGTLGNARWGSRDQTWAGILVPNCLVRTYQGYGGRSKTLAQARADGNLIRTGTWLVDDVHLASDGRLTLSCRDMAKLLIEQQLYPPLIPYPRYPLQWCRYRYTTILTPAIPVYDSSAPPAEYAPEGWIKTIRDGTLDSQGDGYWILGNDGGIFTYGIAGFYGSHGTILNTSELSGIESTTTGQGYWICDVAGHVITFGDAAIHGELPTAPPNPVRRIRALPDGSGYWLMDNDGGVYAFGAAQYYGGTPANTNPFVDMAVTSTGLGYWLLASDGAVYTFGDAPYHGGATATGKVFVGIGARPDDTGYYLAATDGNVYGYGAAPALTPHGNWTFAQANLQDPICAISMMPTGNGYILVGGDGGVFSFGDAPFWGSLPAAFQTTVQTDGTYTDFADIIKILLLWSGWLLYGLGTDTVYGNIESTGSYSNDCLPPDLFDKRPVIDAITAVKEIVGYHFWCDHDGAVRFESPNWYQPGNYVEDGSRSQFIPEVDERQNLVDYGIRNTDKMSRSEFIISSNDPIEGNETTVTTRYTPPFADLTRGMVKPAMWVNGYFTTAEEQELMAELIAIQLFMQQRQGEASCAANPCIQINDQVWVFEEVTGESSMKYVRGISTRADVLSGEYTMTLTLSHLGRFPNDWSLA